MVVKATLSYRNVRSAAGFKLSLPKEVGQWRGDGAEISDESLVELG